MKNDTWRKAAKDLGLNVNMLSRDGFTEKGQLNVMNNMQAYLPINETVERDTISLLVEMAFSSRAYERRNGYDGKYLQPWLAAKIDSYTPHASA